MGTGEGRFNVSLIVKDKVTRRCPQTTTVLKREENRRGIEPRSFSVRACQLNAFTAKAKPASWPPVVCFHGALRPQKWLIRDGHSLALDSALNTKNIMKPPTFRAQELCDSRGGRPGLPVPKTPY